MTIFRSISERRYNSDMLRVVGIVQQIRYSRLSRSCTGAGASKPSFRLCSSEKRANEDYGQAAQTCIRFSQATKHMDYAPQGRARHATNTRSQRKGATTTVPQFRVDCGASTWGILGVTAGVRASSPSTLAGGERFRVVVATT